MTPMGGATIGRKRTMAKSNSHRPASTGRPRPCSEVACATELPAHSSASMGKPARAYSESGHQLEKLEFALAVAITRGDSQRVQQLRQQIADLGGNREEPGT